MSKSKKKKASVQVQNLLETLRDKGRELGVDSKTAVSRLATTIKAEMPTLILDEASRAAAADKAKRHAPKGSTKPGIFSDRLKQNVAKVAHQVNPFGEPAGARKVARELKHLQKQIQKAQRPAKVAKPKIKKSRLPYVIAIACALVLGGGFWMFRTVTNVLPSVQISKVLDYKRWLDHTAGKNAPRAEKATVKLEPRRAEPKLEKVAETPQPVVIHVVNPPVPQKVLTKQSSHGAVGAKIAKQKKKNPRGKAHQAPRRGLAKIERSKGSKPGKTVVYKRLPQ